MLLDEHTGFVVDGMNTVRLDDEGEEHTLLVAKGCRVLAAIAGTSRANKASAFVALENPRFSKVWLAVDASSVEEALDVSEAPEAEIKRAIGDDYMARLLHIAISISRRVSRNGGVGGCDSQAGRRGFC
eukprot:2696721-Pleurochrysis_carterae.AAC.1